LWNVRLELDERPSLARLINPQKAFCSGGGDVGSPGGGGGGGAVDALLAREGRPDGGRRVSWVPPGAVAVLLLLRRM